MGLKELPDNYTDWLPVRASHLQENLQKSEFTTDLFKQYKKHLGIVRYFVLIEGQKLVVPKLVITLLNFSNFSILKPIVPIYKFSRVVKLDKDT